MDIANGQGQGALPVARRAQVIRAWRRAADAVQAVRAEPGAHGTADTGLAAGPAVRAILCRDLDAHPIVTAATGAARRIAHALAVDAALAGDTGTRRLAGRTVRPADAIRDRDGRRRGAERWRPVVGIARERLDHDAVRPRSGVVRGVGHDVERAGEVVLIVRLTVRQVAHRGGVGPSIAEGHGGAVARNDGGERHRPTVADVSGGRPELHADAHPGRRVADPARAGGAAAC